MDTQDIRVIEFGVKPVITPTKLELLKAMKICDILNCIFQDIEDDNCYLSLIKTIA